MDWHSTSSPSSLPAVQRRFSNVSSWVPVERISSKGQQRLSRAGVARYLTKGSFFLVYSFVYPEVDLLVKFLMFFSDLLAPYGVDYLGGQLRSVASSLMLAHSVFYSLFRIPFSIVMGLSYLGRGKVSMRFSRCKRDPAISAPSPRPRLVPASPSAYLSILNQCCSALAGVFRARMTASEGFDPAFG